MRNTWDYLVVTAANARQAEAYRTEIRHRRDAGLLGQVGQVLVVPDIDGHRIGSGASTIQCLLTILNRESQGQAEIEAVLRRLRVLIVHAGGDSRRLPAYSACGKIFVPLPGQIDSPVVTTLFDRLVSTFLELPAGPLGRGQIVVAAGDALICCQLSTADLSRPGVTALGAWTTPDEASRHGVFCGEQAAPVRLYLQKPAVQIQQAAGAIDALGRAVVDVAVMSFDAPSATALLRLFCDLNTLAWKPELLEAALTHGLDLYREICCAMGTEASLNHYIRTARASGSKWEEAMLERLFAPIQRIPLQLQILDPCGFLHFGSTRQLISSGARLMTPATTTLKITTEIEPNSTVVASEAWIEGCRVRAPLVLRGRNVVVGVDVSAPLELPVDACLDVARGSSRRHQPVWFVRCYGVEDSFKDNLEAGATFCGVPLKEWLQAAGARSVDIWPDDVSANDRSLWNARVFPAESEPGSYTRWLWMYHPEQATTEQKRDFLAADRYSASEIALLTDQEAFYRIRQQIHSRLVQRKTYAGISEQQS